jgi:hypothetical protein
MNFKVVWSIKNRMQPRERFRAVGNINIISHVHGTIRLNCWRRETSGSNILVTHDIEFGQSCPLGDSVSGGWTLSDEGYYAFCWLDEMSSDHAGRLMSFTTRTPFIMSVCNLEGTDLHIYAKDEQARG